MHQAGSMQQQFHSHRLTRPAPPIGPGLFRGIVGSRVGTALGTRPARESAGNGGKARPQRTLIAGPICEAKSPAPASNHLQKDCPNGAQLTFIEVFWFLPLWECLLLTSPNHTVSSKNVEKRKLGTVGAPSGAPLPSGSRDLHP